MELNAVLVRLNQMGIEQWFFSTCILGSPPPFFPHLPSDFTVLLGVKSHWDREITLNKMTKVQSTIPLYVGVDGSPCFPSEAIDLLSWLQLLSSQFNSGSTGQVSCWPLSPPDLCFHGV